MRSLLGGGRISNRFDRRADGRTHELSSTNSEKLDGAGASGAANVLAQALSNSPPTDIALSNNTVAENSANGTVIGMFSATDPDVGDTFTFALLDDAGGRFAINGTDLVVAGPLDFETSPDHSVIVRVTDSGGQTFDETFNIAISNLPGATISGTPGDDLIDATHTIDGQPLPTNEEDAISGLDGNDSIAGLGGPDTLVGDNHTVSEPPGWGGDHDTADYSASPAAVIVDLETGIVNAQWRGEGSGGDAEGDVLINIENVVGSSFGDTLRGSNRIMFGPSYLGHNVLIGGAGDDLLYGESGMDTLDGGEGSDVLVGGPDLDNLEGGPGDDTLTGGTGSDYFSSPSLSDLSPETDHITDLELDDYVRLDPDMLFIGTAAFSGVSRQVRYEFVGSTTHILLDSDGDGAADKSVVIDNGMFDLDPSPGSNVLRAMPFDPPGNLAPTDIALSNSTQPENSPNGAHVAGLSANDPDPGDTFTFTLVDDAGGRFAISGTDLVVAGPLDYEAATSHSIIVRVTDSGGATYEETFGITVLNAVGVTIVGTAGDDIVDETQTVAGQPFPTGEEDAIFGGPGLDILNGLDGNDSLLGGRGADTLIGGDGDDILIGSAHGDRLQGGSGADEFLYSSITDFLGPQLEHIADFSSADADWINLAGLDADWTIPGDQAFTFIGAADFSGQPGQLSSNTVAGGVVVRGDINGDAMPDFGLYVLGVAALGAPDFTL